MSNNTASFRTHIESAIKDIRTVLHENPSWMTKKRLKYVEASTDDELIERLLVFIPVKIQNALGVRGLVGIEGLLLLGRTEGECIPDINPGIYLAVGKPKSGEEKVPVCYGGSGISENGTEQRIAQHDNPTYRANHSTKLFYQKLDDPDCPRRAEAVCLAKFARGCPQWVENEELTAVMEHAFIMLLGLLDNGASFDKYKRMDSYGAIRLTRMVPTNRQLPLFEQPRLDRKRPYTKEEKAEIPAFERSRPAPEGQVFPAKVKGNGEIAMAEELMAAQKSLRINIRSFVGNVPMNLCSVDDWRSLYV
ncbi:uncharacterized protein K452DRAFT_296066 [Aplosporella prunicola CBS 121167]|uniref:Uncharacterized protein n=1 Tax=Aplosporella prunicola CBS 121167 TaxID=1176127 RepID=A0A6A6BKK4_9PEZI|nr:uncharacterized protein K452DRAFT_296066 [Aplosporella prunicola CBS 121167]KAF2144650.1 hypothetical protein K452DRAFT_296066 [Aplosporella prunicola CBS 121167]